MFSSLWPPWTVAHETPLSMGILWTRIWELVSMPSSRGSSQPRNRTQVSRIAGRFFTSWATREVPFKLFKKDKKKHISVSQICPFSVISQLPCLCSIASSTWKLFSIFSAWITYIHSSRFSSCLPSSGKLSVCNSEWDRCQIFHSYRCIFPLVFNTVTDFLVCQLWSLNNLRLEVLLFHFIHKIIHKHLLQSIYCASH